MLHQLIRYRPIIKILRKEKYEPVLEIGPGSQGITKFMDVMVYGVDMDFKDYTGSMREISPDIIPAIANAENLPFRDGSFDMVFSCDMLEHVPANRRIKVVSEMVRVAKRKVVLVFPCGQGALTGDRLLNRMCRTFGRKAPGWLAEHLDLDFPTRDEALSIAGGLGLPYRVRGNAFLPLHYLVLAAESVGGIKKLSSDFSAIGRKKPRGLKMLLLTVTLNTLLAFSDLWPTYRVMIEIDKP